MASKWDFQRFKSLKWTTLQVVSSLTLSSSVLIQANWQSTGDNQADNIIWCTGIAAFCFKFQDQDTYSLQCFPYISYGTGWENLFVNHCHYSQTLYPLHCTLNQVRYSTVTRNWISLSHHWGLKKEIHCTSTHKALVTRLILNACCVRPVLMFLAWISANWINDVKMWLELCLVRQQSTQTD